MKNIFILPTEKDSNLCQNLNLDLEMREIRLPNRFEINQFIYITNKEDIREGDWVTDGMEFMKASSKLVEAQCLVNRREWSKIVLTNDPQLIADGVQEVSSSFLSFFAANQPDYVEVIYEPKNFLDVSQGWEYYLNFTEKEDKTEETPNSKLTNQKYLDKMNSDDITEKYTEEAAIDYCDKFFGKDRTTYQWNKGYTTFINSAKWQKERSYSQDDMIKMYKAGYLRSKSGHPYKIL